MKRSRVVSGRKEGVNRKENVKWKEGECSVEGRRVFSGRKESVQ